MGQWIHCSVVRDIRDIGDICDVRYPNFFLQMHGQSEVDQARISLFLGFELVFQLDSIEFDNNGPHRSASDW